MNSEKGIDFEQLEETLTDTELQILEVYRQLLAEHQMLMVLSAALSAACDE